MKRLAIFTGILSGLLFGIATPFSKMLLAGLNTFQLAGLLYLGAALAMLPWLFRKDNNITMLFQKRNVSKTFGIILFGGFLGPLLLLAGLKLANAASVSIWLNMELVATAVLGVLIFKDSIDRYTLIGVLLTFAAGVITSLGEGTAGFLPGLLIVAACFCWGIDNHLTALTDGASPQTVTFIKGIVAGSVNLMIGFLISNQPFALSVTAIAIAVGIFSYGFSIVLYVTSAQNIGATRSQILFSTAPLWGVILSYIILGESFQLVHLISITLLALAVVITNIFVHSHKHEHTALEHIHYHKHTDDHHDHDHGDAEIPPNKWHSHMHKHDPKTHQHPHDPDLHHRHEH